MSVALVSIVLILIPNPITYIIGVSLLSVALLPPVLYFLYAVYTFSLDAIISGIQSIKNKISASKELENEHSNDADTLMTTTEHDKTVTERWPKTDVNSASYKNPRFASSHQSEDSASVVQEEVLTSPRA